MAYHIDQLEPGMSASTSKTVTETDIILFAGISTDVNPAIYLSQTLKFKAPVKPGDTVTATVTVREVNLEKNRVILDTVCTVGGKTVIDGECVMMPPVRAKSVGGTA